MNTIRRFKPRAAGLSLVEVLLACAIVGLILPVLMSAVSSHTRVSEKAGAHQFAAATARRILERVRQCDFALLLASCGPEQAIQGEALSGFAGGTVRGKQAPAPMMSGTLQLESASPGLIRIRVRIDVQDGGSRVELVRWVSDPSHGWPRGSDR